MAPMKEQAHPGPFLTTPPPQPVLGDSLCRPLPSHSAGSPKPTIQWSKLRSPLPWQHRLEGDTLIIPRVAQQDSGQYICNASSPAGHAEATVVLHVESKALAHPPQATFSAPHGDPSAPHHPPARLHPGRNPGSPIWRVAGPSGPGSLPSPNTHIPTRDLALPHPLSSGLSVLQLRWSLGQPPP